ncbi:MAG: hypothetical protein ACKOAD_08760 [Gammaproteobacteria bacterium]
MDTKLVENSGSDVVEVDFANSQKAIKKPVPATAELEYREFVIKKQIIRIYHECSGFLPCNHRVQVLDLETKKILENHPNQSAKNIIEMFKKSNLLLPEHFADLDGNPILSYVYLGSPELRMANSVIQQQSEKADKKCSCMIL